MIDGIDWDKVEEIKAGMNCTKGFKCAESGFDQVCKAKDIGLKSYVDCLEEHAHGCTYALPFGDGYYCRCPLRVYLAKNENGNGNR
jgi:hypothetical protein